jgi:hypothetical protein
VEDKDSAVEAVVSALEAAEVAAAAQLVGAAWESSPADVQARVEHELETLAWCIGHCHPRTERPRRVFQYLSRRLEKACDKSAFAAALSRWVVLDRAMNASQRKPCHNPRGISIPPVSAEAREKNLVLNADRRRLLLGRTARAQ